MSREHPFFSEILPTGIWECTFPNGEMRTDVLDPQRGFVGEVKSAEENERATVSDIELPEAAIETFLKLAPDRELALLVGSIDHGYATVSDMLVVNYEGDLPNGSVQPVVERALSLFQNDRRHTENVIGVFKPGSAESLYYLLSPEIGMGVVIGGEFFDNPEGKLLHISALSSTVSKELFWVNIVCSE